MTIDEDNSVGSSIAPTSTDPPSFSSTTSSREGKGDDAGDDDDPASTKDNDDDDDDDDDDDEGLGIHTGNRNENHTPEVEVAKTEDRWVWRLRLLTALVLTCVAVAVCLTVYFLTRKGETQDFEEDFIDLSGTLVTSFSSVVQDRFGILTSFAAEITANSNRSLPFVTPPGYAHRAETVSKLAHVAFLMLLPRIETDQFDEWNAYATANQGWKAEGMAIAAGIDDPNDVNAAPIFPVMFNVHTEDGVPAPQDGPGPYWPLWMTYPVHNQSGININLYNDIEHQNPIDTTYKTQNPTIEQSNDYINVKEEERDGRYSFLKKNENIDYQDDPFAIAFIPVFDTLDAKNQKVAGVLFSLVYWRDYFDQLLPPGAKGIIVILENDCGQQYTYQIDGGNYGSDESSDAKSAARFIGFGDLHDTKYDYLGTGTELASIITTTTKGGVFEDDNKDETANENEKDASLFPDCLYKIRVYPSQLFEDSHYSDNPWMYAIVLACLFLVTSAVFLLYDCMVERRQSAVMKSAQQSGKLVQSLFPDDVRDRLYAEQEEQKAKKKTTPDDWKGTSTRQLQVGGGEMSGGSGGNLEHQQHSRKEAIAKLYPETTIFFADIAGFTNWSSTRSPSEVFQLLETLYGAFDAIATRRKVFKVETIGDCYVAVAGLPEPREDHAEIMVKFSRDCIVKMSLISESLSESLGPDTADLAMRIGLHTGPVTAGVLRGQKSRFQLFGDTVNTASRMESHGERGRIHASQATADALIYAGKADWLVCREGAVSVKGKGDMQTYWIKPSIARTNRSVVSSTNISSVCTSEIPTTI